MPQVRLRLATPADAPGLARVFVLAWRSGYVGIVEEPVLDALDEIEIADWLGTMTSSNGPTTWLAESADGGVLAFSRHGEDPEDSRRGHIYSLYVDPAATGRGIAKALLDHDLQLLGERGLGTVTLWVFEHNQAARGLYTSFGFLPDGARRVEPRVWRSRDPDAPASSPGNGERGEMSEHEVTGQETGQMTGQMTWPVAGRPFPRPAPARRVHPLRATRGAARLPGFADHHKVPAERLARRG